MICCLQWASLLDYMGITMYGHCKLVICSSFHPSLIILIIFSQSGGCDVISSQNYKIYQIQTKNIAESLHPRNFCKKTHVKSSFRSKEDSHQSYRKIDFRAEGRGWLGRYFVLERHHNRKKVWTKMSKNGENMKISRVSPYCTARQFSDQRASHFQIFFQEVWPRKSSIIVSSFSFPL